MFLTHLWAYELEIQSVTKIGVYERADFTGHYHTKSKWIHLYSLLEMCYYPYPS